VYLSGNIRLHRIVPTVEKIVGCGEAGNDSGKRRKQEAGDVAAGQ